MTSVAITGAFIQQFAREWVAAWNAHDLPRVLAHYADDFEMNSPLIVELMGEPSGRLKGKTQVAAYWRRALDRNPDLKFELLHTLAGASSVVIFYRTRSGRHSAEVLFFNENGLVERGVAHYSTD